MLYIRYERFVITYYTSWLAKQILSTLYVKFESRCYFRLYHRLILQKNNSLSSVIISSALVWLLGD